MNLFALIITIMPVKAKTFVCRNPNTYVNFVVSIGKSIVTGKLAVFISTAPIIPRALLVADNVSPAKNPPIITDATTPHVVLIAFKFAASHVAERVIRSMIERHTNAVSHHDLPGYLLNIDPTYAKELEGILYRATHGVCDDENTHIVEKWDSANVNATVQSFHKENIDAALGKHIAVINLQKNKRSGDCSGLFGQKH